MFGAFQSPGELKTLVLPQGHSHRRQRNSRERTEGKCPKKSNFGEDGHANDLLNFQLF